MIKVCKKIWFVFPVSLTLMLLMTGCNIIQSSALFDTITKEEEVETFHGKYLQQAYLGGELIEVIDGEEWKGKGRKYHVIAEVKTKKEYVDEEITNDMELDDEFVLRNEEDIINGNQCLIYLPYQNKYYMKDISLVTEITEGISRAGISGVLETGYLKDYVMELISILEKDYSLSIEDDIRINGRLTQHVVAIPKDGTASERVELWIDQNTWLVVKELQAQGNSISTFEYTEFQLNSIINDKKFAISVPEGAEVEQINEGIEQLNEEVSLDEAVNRLGMNVYYFKEADKLKLSEMHYIEDSGAPKGRLESTYITDSGSKIIIGEEPITAYYKQVELDYEKINIKGMEVSYIETERSKIIMFTTDESVCHIRTQNSNMSKKEFLDLMEFLEIKNFYDTR